MDARSALRRNDRRTFPRRRRGDYDIAGAMALAKSSVGDLALGSAAVEATLQDSQLALIRFDAAGPAIAGNVTGSLDFRGPRVDTDVAYDISRADLEQLRVLTGGESAG